MTIEVLRVPDEELEGLAKKNGPSSLEAHVLRNLRSLRSKDRQAYAFKFGRYMIAATLRPTINRRTVQEPSLRDRLLRAPSSAPAREGISLGKKPPRLGFPGLGCPGRREVV